MKIGIDIDEVLAAQLEELVKFYHLKTGKLIPYEKFHTYYWPEVWGISLEEAVKIDREFKLSKQFDNVKPLKGAVESVNKLIDKNEIIVITSRPVIFKEKTENWLKKHMGNIPMTIIHSDDFHAQNKTKSKVEICKELGIKIMIEDQDKYAIGCAEEGIKVILFDKPWNQGVSHKNIIRVKNWKEAMKEIDKLKL